MRLKIASFDLDGTLVRDTVFETVSRTAGFHEKILQHDADYVAGKITLEECFHLEYKYLVGLPMEIVEAAMVAGRWTPGIEEAVASLKAAGLRTIVLTDQPRFLAEWTKRFGFDGAVCSEARLDDGVVTAEVEPRFDKLANLRSWADKGRLSLSEIVHVGNGANDAAVFREVGYGIAVDPATPGVAKAADAVVERMADLRQAAEIILANPEGRKHW